MNGVHAGREGRSIATTGFSLVELLVATAIGALVTLLVATVFANSSKTNEVSQATNEIQEQAAVALEMLQRDLRVAGYSGCNSNRMLGSGGLVNTVDTPNGYLNALGVYIQGYEGTGAAFDPLEPAEVTGATPAPLDESDAVTVRIPAVREPVALSGTMANASAAIPVFTTTGFVAGMRAVVSDCSQSAAFVVTGTAVGLAHDAGAQNATADLGRAFGPDASVVPMQTITYYVGRSSLAPLGTEQSLWRRVDTAAASEEVAEGVEDFQLLYGIDTDDDRSADTFDTADTIADWNQVIAVRASLLLRSKSPNAARNPQRFDFNGQVDVVPADQRLRRPFNVTILLRNRTP
ncbi:MAG: PilW family protein [Gammaproteobacteria bacterium]|nr:PilW family protein [Gammaproteobacteria bacterium]